MKPCPNDPNQCDCRVCFLYLTDERYRKLWQEPDPSDLPARALLLRRYKERASLACVYLGPALEETASCGCAGAIKHQCGIHGECRRFGNDASGIKICRDCDDYSSNGMPIVENVYDPIPQEYRFDGGQELTWKNDSAGFHLEAFTRMIEADPGKPSSLDGDGIVYVGGGKYWPGIVIGIRLLRESGCQLPIEVWHRGESEPVDLESIDGIDGVFVRDITKQSIPYRAMGGWEAKLFAITHSKFKRILFLDADAYCVTDPTEFIQSQQAPFEFWKDLHANEGTVRWNVVWPSGKNGVPPIQGGQLLIDREKAWKLIVVSHWMCQHSDFYFKHMFGDQDTWRVAAAAINDSSLWNCLGDSPWRGVAFVLQDRDKKDFIVHRCQGKLFPVNEIPEGKTSYTSPKYGLPMESRVFQLLSESCKKQETSSSIVFDSIYQKKLWGNGSGSGSDQKHAKAYLDIINSEIKNRNAKVIVDLGSGDGAIAGQIMAQELRAIDCVKLNGFVRKLDFYNEKEMIPDGDLYLMKDVLHHWSNNMIRNWLGWFIGNRKGVLIACQDFHQHSDDDDCPIGGYRALRHTMSPLKKFRPVKIAEFFGKEVLLFNT